MIKILIISMVKAIIFCILVACGLKPIGTSLRVNKVDAVKVGVLVNRVNIDKLLKEGDKNILVIFFRGTEI